jgi:ParB-like chromosome segregation protein Spo0J
MAFSENVTREGLTPVEEGRALEKLAELLKFETHEQLAAAVSQPVLRVQRVRRIASAPEFIQSAVVSGSMVVVAKSPAGETTKERRQLDLMAGLAFQRLYEHQVRKGVKKDKAELRTTNAMHRALASNWPLRRVEEFVKTALSSKQELSDTPDAPEATPPAPSSIFEATPQRFVVDLKKFAKASPEQHAALRAAFERLFQNLPAAGSEELTTGKYHR